MAATIDERIVAMSFENQVFEQRAAQTIITLGKMNTAIKSMDSAKGLEDIEKSGGKVTLKGPMAALDALKSKLGRSGDGAAQGFSEIEKASSKVTLEGTGRAIDKAQSKLDHLGAGSTFTDIEKASNQVELAGISKAIDAVSGKFGLLQNAASVAIGGITANAAMKGASFTKSFALGPITQGLDEYKTNLGSIQTILANTQGQQISGLDEVNKHLGELNTYSDQTIYNFSEMAKNIGTFTAAGVDLDTSTQSIKGIANLAALSGSNSQQASTAMYQLSQAIASGKVGLQDWNSVVNAGMGGAVFQKALLRTADNMGAISKGALKIDKTTGKATVNGESFRESIMAKPGQKSWLTDEVLTNTLKQLTGDMTDAQLAAEGFTAEQIKAIQAQAKTAKAAATEVKTLPQVFDVARETIGSGWAKTFQFIFGDFNQSKKTFTAMSNFINGFINKVSNARNKMLEDWSNLGGRDNLLRGLKLAFSNLTDIIKPIHDAFREIFPATTGKDLARFTSDFGQLMLNLKPSAKTIDNLQRTFAGLFAVVHIGWDIVKSLGEVIFNLLGVVGKGAGGFLSFTGGIGDFLVAIDAALTKGNTFKAIFTGIAAVLAVPLKLIVAIGKAIVGMFGGDKGDAAAGLSKSLSDVNDKLGPLKTVIDVVVKLWDKLVDVLGKAKAALEPWFDAMVSKLSGFGQLIADAFANMNFDQVMSVIQTGLVGGIFVALKKGLGSGISVFGDAFEGINGLLKGLTGNLTAMQKNVQANTLLAIGAAILVLAAGVKVLSTIDGPSLAKAMTGVAIGLGELVGAMKLMTAGLGKAGALLLPFIAAGLIGVAIAVTILAGAMKIFATMKWEDIAKGLAGIVGALDAITLSIRAVPKTLPLTAAGLILVGVALNIIAVAMKAFGAMKWEEMAKGLFGVVEAIGGIAFAVSFLPPTLPLTAAGLVIMGIALASLAGAIKAMGSLDLLTMIKGLGAMMAAIAGIGVAVSLIPPTIGLSAIGLLIVGSAMVVVAKAIGILGSLSVGKLVKGLVGLAGALLILAGGLTLMIATLPGSAALLAAAAALAVLVPVLAVLGTMEWGTIFKGLAAMALILVTIGVAGLIAAPALAAIGIALIPLGAGFLLVATAAKIFSGAIALLSTEGQKGVGVFLAALTGFVALLPTIVIQMLKGMVDVANSVVALAPKLVIALGVVIDTILAFVIASAPKLAKAIGVLVEQIVQVLTTNAPKLIAMGNQLILNLLSGISQNISQVTSKVAEIIVKFLDSLRAKMPDLVTAGANLLKSFLNGVGSKFGEIANSVANLIVKFTAAVGNQASKITDAAATMMGKFLGALATFGPQLVTKGGEVIFKFLEGIGNKGPEIIKKGVAIAGKLLKGLADGLVDLADMGFNALIDFLHGFAQAIRDNSHELNAAGIDVGKAIIEGAIDGMTQLKGALQNVVEGLFKGAIDIAKKVLKIKSPSKVFAEIGSFAMGGLILGLGDSGKDIQDAVLGVGGSAMKGLAQGLGDNQGEATNAAMAAGGAVVGAMSTALGTRAGQPSEVFRDIGMNVSRGFKQGLLGSKDDVLSAFDDMNSSLIDKIRDLRTQVADGTTKIGDLSQQYADKLKEIARLRSEKKPDADAIDTAVKESEELQKQLGEETKAVNQNGKALTAARNIRASLTGSMHDEKMQLLGLKKDYEDISKQLDDATATLNDLTNARAAAQQKYIDQYSVKPDVDNLLSTALADADLTASERQDKIRQAQIDADKKAKIDQVALYVQALKDQLAATAKYQATLQKLREMGLDDETYQKLLDKGLEGADFADQILKSGKQGIDQINALDSQILAKSTDLANQAAKNLYDAGVAAAQGLVDGLTTKKADLDKAMTDLADVMVNAIKSKLKIKSPSRIFEELGKFTGEGLVQGLGASSQAVTGAASALGDDAKAALSSSLSRILDTVSGEIDPTLTITPVLDMTQIRKDAAGIKDLSNVIPISAATSYGMGSATSQEVSDTQQAALEAAAEAAKPSVEYTQNNYSPEALSAIEIYRRTNNQLGQIKSALGVPA